MVKEHVITLINFKYNLMKLWVARNEGYEEEVLHDRFEHVSGELFIFYPLY